MFKLIGTGNLLSVKDMINMTRREILKSPPDSWHTQMLRVYLSDVFVQLEAVTTALNELSQVEKVLEGDKYKKVPYGYHLKCTMIIQQLHAMAKHKMKYMDKMKDMVGVVEEFIKETGFTMRGTLETQRLNTIIMLDKSRLPEYVAHAMKVGDTLR